MEMIDLKLSDANNRTGTVLGGGPEEPEAGVRDAEDAEDAEGHLVDGHGAEEGHRDRPADPWGGPEPVESVIEPDTSMMKTM